MDDKTKEALVTATKQFCGYVDHPFSEITQQYVDELKRAMVSRLKNGACKELEELAYINAHIQIYEEIANGTIWRRAHEWQCVRIAEAHEREKQRKRAVDSATGEQNSALDDTPVFDWPIE